MATKNTISKYITVPCGVCNECLCSKQKQLVQRVECMLLDNYMFFGTLTYNNEMLRKVTTSTGFNIAYADLNDFQDMIKRIRKMNPFNRSLKYICVSERGSTFGRPHLHFLMFIQKFKDDDKLFVAQLESSLRGLIFSEWRRNIAVRVRKKDGKLISDSIRPVYKPLFTYHTKYANGKLNTNFDVHYCVPFVTENGCSDVAFYVTKYILKPNDKEKDLQQALSLNLDSKEYKEVWNKVRSRCICSKFFGNSSDIEIDYVKSCIKNSIYDSDGLKFYASSGKPYHLAHHYKKYIDAESLVSSVRAKGGPIVSDERSFFDRLQSIERGKHIVSQIAKKEFSELFPND